MFAQWQEKQLPARRARSLGCSPQWICWCWYPLSSFPHSHSTDNNTVCHASWDFVRNCPGFFFCFCTYSVSLRSSSSAIVQPSRVNRLWTGLPRFVHASDQNCKCLKFAILAHITFTFNHDWLLTFSWMLGDERFDRELEFKSQGGSKRLPDVPNVLGFQNLFKEFLKDLSRKVGMLTDVVRSA